jgi:hypothetical protein
VVVVTDGVEVRVGLVVEVMVGVEVLVGLVVEVTVGVEVQTGVKVEMFVGVFEGLGVEVGVADWVLIGMSVFKGVGVWLEGKGRGSVLLWDWQAAMQRTRAKEIPIPTVLKGCMVLLLVDASTYRAEKLCLFQRKTPKEWPEFV